MKTYTIMLNQFDYCDFWETILAHYKNKEMAVFLCEELNVRFADKFRNFYVEEWEVNDGEDVCAELDKIIKNYEE